MADSKTAGAWPDLCSERGPETSRTLQLWSQVVGKTRLALAPTVNHWWHVALYVSARGLTTSPMPVPDGSGRELEVELDLVWHRLELRSSDGGFASFALEPGTLAGFYRRYRAALGELGVSFDIFPRAVEIPEIVELDRDETFRDYDPDWANAFYRALVSAHRLLSEFRAEFVGKVSPVHFFWGSFDLAVTRFSGRSAPTHPGGIPNVADYVAEEAYSHEVSSAGFWPGDARFPEAAFYSYAYPEPIGFAQALVQPPEARYEPSLGEFVLPYAAVRSAEDPDAAVRAFLETTYAAAADLGGWDRRALERRRAPRLSERRAGAAASL